MTDPFPFRSRVFLCGADMRPSAIRRRWPAARFVALARAGGFLTRGIGLPSDAFGPEVWGIVVETGERQRGTPLPVTLRDGTETTAMIVGDPSEIGSPDEILAQARYWELPEAYRERIEAYIASAS